MALLPVLPLTTANASPVAKTTVTVPSPVHVHRVITAGGVRQFIDCNGPTSAGANRAAPTVVLVSGLGAGSAYWSKVRTMLLPTTRVCVYDRPGLGASPGRVATRVVNATVHAAELGALLHAAGENKPFVLVGHSYGGLIVRAFAIRYPTRVAAMMLLDACYADQWKGGGRYWSEPRARIDMLANQKIVWGLPRLGKKPLIVMTAGIGSSSNWIKRQKAMATMSSNSVHVIIKRSSHVIQQHNPAAVAGGVRQLVVAVVNKRPLPRCKTVAPAWAHVGATCIS